MRKLSDLKPFEAFVVGTGFIIVVVVLRNLMPFGSIHFFVVATKAFDFVLAILLEFLRVKFHENFFLRQVKSYL